LPDCGWDFPQNFVGFCGKSMKRQEILKRRIRARAVQKITQSEKGDKNRFFCGEKRLFLSNYARNWQWIIFDFCGISG
jgi:hypothetical protein